MACAARAATRHRPKRGLMTPDELFRGFQDHARFCRESLTVQNLHGLNEPMELGPGQSRLHEAIATQRKRGVPVRILYLKARRVWATVGTAAEFFHVTPFNAGVHTAVIAHSEDSVLEIFGHYKRFQHHYRPFGNVIRLPRLVDSRGKPIHIPLSDRLLYENHSWIQIHTAANPDFGRSFRLTNVHFSEFPYYPNPTATLSAMMSAMPKLPETCAVIEGTAKTIGDTFNKMWQAAMDRNADSEWLGIFMAWWEQPQNRMPLVVAADRFQESLTREEREEMGRYNLTLEQLAWRRWTIANDFNGDLQRFRREHPSRPEDAFMANSRNRFSIPHIMRMPIQRDPMTGELAVEQVGIERRTVFLPGERGALRVWRRPEKGRLYVLGADCAQGLDASDGSGETDPDYSASQVLDRDSGEQCAVLHARMMPGETGRYNAALGRWYNNAQVCGERNPGGGGVSMLEAMLNADYPASLIYHRPVNPEQDPQVRGDKIGWDTSGVSRPILISELDEVIRQMAIAIHDPMTQMELLTFVIWPDGKAKAQKGCHDDLVIALALAIIALARMPRPRPTEKERRAPEVMKYGRGPQDEGRGRIVRVR